MKANNFSHNYISEQASVLFGLNTKVVGKTQVRQGFFPLINALQRHSCTIEITERNNPVAVLLSYEQYAALIYQLAKLTAIRPEKKVDLKGSVTIVGDLDSAGKHITAEFADAIERSAARL